MQYVTTKDLSVAICLINKEIAKMEHNAEHPPVFGNKFTEKEIKDRKEKLKEDRWYKDLLDARENFNIKVSFDIIEKIDDLQEVKE